MADNNNGWIESIDPTSGRTFYANKYTRTTQWDPPPGFRSSSHQTNKHGASASSHHHHRGRGSTSTTGNDNFTSGMDIARAQMESMKMNNNNNKHHAATTSSKGASSDPNALPDGWEEMTDATTGRTFFIDHATKTTSWERPTKATHGGRNVVNDDDNGFGFSTSQAMMKLNQNGSHNTWDENPHSGSRASHTHNHNHGYEKQHSYTTMGLDSTSESAGPPPLDFVVVSVPDAMRMDCPGCYAGFTYTKRRHHCRLCGDVFCDACSSSRTILPLDGPEYATPVRVCDWCMKDVKKGNYFSLRRYLTPLQLFDPTKPTKRLSDNQGGGSGEATNEITLNTVAASLSSLSADIDAMIVEPTQFQEKITIPASVLVPAVGKHLKERTTAEYAIRVLASLCMLGNVVGDDMFGLAMYEGDTTGIGGEGIMKKSDSVISLSSSDEEGPTNSSRPVVPRKKKKECEIVNDVLSILEWNGSDSRSLSALEQAAKVVYYITEPDFVAGVLSRYDTEKEGGDNGPVDVDAFGEALHNIISIDIHRAFRSMLDHATSSASPSLQRWATATLRHLINEDQRRACVYSSGPNKYTSFMNQLVSTGGIMILCSLLSSDDAETRTHATSTLEAIVVATREIGLVLNTSSTTGGFSRVGRGTPDDSRIVDAIVSNGGCGPALVHLLISADESVAMMGCSFASSLISPLLTDPRGSGKALQQCLSSSGGGGSGFEVKDDGLSSYRQAALALVVGEGSGGGSQSEMSCLPSLIQILRSGAEDSSWGNPSRSIKLQVVAGECLAAISLAIGHIVGDSSAEGSYDSLYMRARKALEIMEHERIFDVAYRLVTSASSRSLDPSRNTPQARLREAAGLTLLALSSCSSVSVGYLTSNKAVSGLLNIATESIGAPSALRGEWASRGLCYLETCAMLLLRAWKNNDDSCLNHLIDALDAGVVGLASQLVKAKVHLKHHDKAYSQMRIKMAICYMLAAMFGIANSGKGKNDVGISRLYSAVDADCAAALAYGNESQGRTDLVASTVHLLGATLPYASRFASEDRDEPLPMMDLSEACLLAVGSMCGAATVCLGKDSFIDQSMFGEQEQDKYSHLRQDTSSMVCRALTSAKNGGALLPSVLIGALGESLVVPALRATLAIAQHHHDLRGELARSGMLVPVGDILQQSLSSGERYTFSVCIAIVRFCGPWSRVEGSNNGSIVTLQNAIRTLACVLMISEREDGATNESQRNKLLWLKFESLLALEELSSNDLLHSTMAGDAFPALTAFLMQLDGKAGSSTEIDEDDMMCSALKTIQKIISLPSSTSSAAAEGMISSLVKILNDHPGNQAGSRKLNVSLELLHAIATGKSATVGNGQLLSSGVMESVASLLGDGETSSKLTLLGLEIIEIIIADVESSQLNPSLRDAMLGQFVSLMSGQEQFLRALIAAALSLEGDGNEYSNLTLYGSPLVLPNGNDARIAEMKAINILFDISTLLCSDVAGVGREQFLQAFMLKSVRGSAETVAFAASIFLQLLMDEENGLCVPQNPQNRKYFLEVKLPTIRSQLFDALNTSLDECMSSASSREHAESLVCVFKIPQVCLLFCQSKAESQAAFDLYENVVQSLPIEMVGDMLLADKSSLVALFNLVIGNNDMVPGSKQAFAATLGNLAKAGLLAVAVERFGARNNAIAALSAAMQGPEEVIDEDEDSLSRICVECLASILCNDQPDGLGMSALEARAIASATGKILSKTVLNRFFTQASLETTFDDSMDHSSDRAAISQSAEARLLCSMASYPDTLEMLGQVGGLEAIGLIAHEGSLPAIQAIQKACELNPRSVVNVDCHISIMDALAHVESKLASGISDAAKLREVTVKCIQIITSLSKDRDTKAAVLLADQSFDCLRAAACIVSKSAKLQLPEKKTVSVKKIDAEEGNPFAKESETKQKEETDSDDLQLGDLVLIDSSQPSPSKDSHVDEVVDQLEGVVAHLGAVQFAPGSDWVGVRLSGASTGMGKNDGSVKDIQYFDSLGDKNGVFVKKNTMKKKACETEESEHIGEVEVNNADARVESGAEIETVVGDRQEHLWGHLISKDDFTLSRAAFSLLLSFSSSKPHRDMLMRTETFEHDLSSVIKQQQSPELIGFQCKALDLLVSFTFHVHKADSELTSLLCSVIASRTKTLQISRDKQALLSSKQLLTLALSGVQNLFVSFMDEGEKILSLKLALDLFVFLADSLYKGSKSRRMSVSEKDGVLFYHLSTFFLLSLGSDSLRSSILSTKFVASVMRYIMMTSGLPSFDRSIPLTEQNGGEYWNAALSHCLHYLSCLVTESSQDNLGKSFVGLIDEVQGPSKSFHLCLEHIAGGKLSDASCTSKQVLARLDRLSD